MRNNSLHRSRNNSLQMKTMVKHTALGSYVYTWLNKGTLFIIDSFNIKTFKELCFVKQNKCLFFSSVPSILPDSHPNFHVLPFVTLKLNANQTYAQKHLEMRYRIHLPCLIIAELCGEIDNCPRCCSYIKLCLMNQSNCFKKTI